MSLRGEGKGDVEGDVQGEGSRWIWVSMEVSWDGTST